MAKHTKISAGYRLTVTSWENDGDNYNTIVEEGLTKERTVFLVGLCKLLSEENNNSRSYAARLNNLYDATTSEIERVDAALAELTHQAAKELFSDASDYAISDIDAVDYAKGALHDLGLSGEEYITRVCESYKVEYVPIDVTLEDVTAEF